MAKLPAPLTPHDTDLRTLGYMPLRVNDLRDSDFAAIANDAEFRAGVMLWCAAWHQVPAASLPDDDRLLRGLAGFGKDTEAWMLVKKVALHGFIKCEDGRLYHPIIADLALSAAKKQRRDVERTRNATEARRNRNVQRDVGRDDQRDDEENSTLRPPRERERDIEGKGDKKEEGYVSVSGETDPSSKPKKISYPKDFEEFWKAYPTDQLMSKKDAGAAWSRLSVEDRVSALEAVPSFRSYCTSDATYRPLHAVRFLSQRRFEGFLNGHKTAGPASIDEAKMIKLLEIGRTRKVWQVEKFGPMPNQPGCIVPSHLLKPGDGEGWTEWKAQR